MLQNLKNIQTKILYISVFLYPLFFLPFFTNKFESAKILLLLIVSSILLALKAIEFFIEPKLKINHSAGDLLIYTFAAVYLMAAIFIAPNFFDAFFMPGTATFAIFAVILYFFFKQMNPDQKNQSINYLMTSAMIAVLLQMLVFLGAHSLIPQLENYLNDSAFSTFGNMLSTTVFLVVTLVISIKKIVTDPGTAGKITATACAFLTVVGLFVAIYLMLPGKPSKYNQLSISESWVIAVDNLKQNALGVGPGYFTSAYLKSRPLTTNYKDTWLVAYNQSHSTVLTAFTELGILGLLLWIGLTLYILKRFLSKSSFYLPGLVFLLMFWVLPLSYSLLPLFFYVVALGSTNHKTTDITSSVNKVFIFPTIALVGYVLFIFAKMFVADYIFNKSLSYRLRSDASNSYATAISAINWNRSADYYHLYLADLNISLIQAIGKKEKIEEKDKEDMANLLKQAVNETRAAVSLNPKKSGNWEALAKIYTAIIPYAEGSDKFATQAYNQAIFLNPLNPLIRIDLGGIYYNTQQYELAIDIFKLAVLAKNDHPNSRYNLAAAYRESGQIDKAITEMETLLKVVKPGTSEYTQIENELKALKDKKAPAQKEEAPLEVSGDDSTLPDTTPTIEIPQEENQEASEVIE